MFSRSTQLSTKTHTHSQPCLAGRRDSVAAGGPVAWNVFGSCLSAIPSFHSSNDVFTRIGSDLDDLMEVPSLIEAKEFLADGASGVQENVDVSDGRYSEL